MFWRRSRQKKKLPIALLGRSEKKEIYMLWTIVVILFVLWLLGLLGGIGGGLVHLLLVAAVIIILYNLFVGGRRSRI
jgi:hypothetical protein